VAAGAALGGVADVPWPGGVLLGAFVSRTSWGLTLFGSILTIGGVAGGMAAIYDVSTGRATVGDVFTDIGIFIEGWIVELIARPMMPNSRRPTPMRWYFC
jgi:hypothetical protein